MLPGLVGLGCHLSCLPTFGRLPVCTHLCPKFVVLPLTSATYFSQHRCPSLPPTHQSLAPAAFSSHDFFIELLPTPPLHLLPILIINTFSFYQSFTTSIPRPSLLLKPTTFRASDSTSNRSKTNTSTQRHKHEINY